MATPNKSSTTVKSNSKKSNVTPKKSVVISKKIVKSSTPNTPKSIPVQHKVVYTKPKATTKKVTTKKVSTKSSKIPVKKVVIIKPTTQKPQDDVSPTPIVNPEVEVKPTTVETPSNVDVAQNNGVTNNDSTKQTNATEDNKTYTVNETNQVQNNNTSTPIQEQNPVKPNVKKKKKKRVWIEVVTAIALFGTVAAGAGYYIYKLCAQQEQKYEREVVGASEKLNVSSYSDKDNFYITLTSSDKSYEITSLVEVTIDGKVVDPSNYTYDKSSKKITFTIKYLKEHEGKISIKTTIEKIPTIKLDKTTLEVDEDVGTIQLTATTDGLKEGDVVKWESSNNSFGSVDNNGLVTIYPFSETQKPDSKFFTITASLSVSKKSATCKITVNRLKYQATYVYIGFNASDIETTEESDIDHYRVACNNVDICEVATIPAQYKGKDIIGIGNVSRTTIGFKEASKLTSVKFENPENIKDFTFECFSMCSSLKEIEKTPNLLSIGEFCFKECFSMPSFTIYSNVKTIGENAFQGIGKNKVPIYFEDEVNTEWYIKYGHDSQTITGIVDVKGLDPLTCSDLLCNSYHDYIWSKISEDAVYGYQGYTSDGQKTSEESNINYYKIYCNNENRNLVLKAFIPDKYKNKPIKGFVRSGDTSETTGFYNCENLKTITFENPSNFDTIDDFSFTNCKSLKSIDFSSFNNLKSIGESAFEGCENLESIITPTHDKFTSLLPRCFFNCTSLKRFNSDEDGVCHITDNIRSISQNAFAYKEETQVKFFTQFSKIIFDTPDNAALVIHKDAFGDFDETNTGVFYKDETLGINFIRNSKDNNDHFYMNTAFESGSKIKANDDLIIPDGCKNLANNIIYNLTLKSITIPTSVTYIEPFFAGKYPNGSSLKSTFNTITFKQKEGVNDTWYIEYTHEGSYFYDSDTTYNPFKSESYETKNHVYLEGVHSGYPTMGETYYRWSRNS